MPQIDVDASYTYIVESPGETHATMKRAEGTPASRVYVDPPIDGSVLLAVERERDHITFWIPTEDIPTLIDELSEYVDEEVDRG